MAAGRVAHVAIAGAGIAGLTAAIAFARGGFQVTLLEQAERLDDVGAGIQLSPNATRILAGLDMLPALLPVAVRPDAVVMRKAATLDRLASVPLGEDASRRWRAPYLTAHRADLQSALTATLRRHPEVEFVTGAAVRDAAFHQRGVTLSVDRDGKVAEVACDLAVGADGVWSTLRGLGGHERGSRFTGHLAWRAMLRPEPGAGAAQLLSSRDVTALLHPGFHLVAYPVRGGEAINLVAVTRANETRARWSNDGDRAELEAAMAGAAPALLALVRDAGPWTTWPIHEVDHRGAWTSGAGIALIGDAAHAMTPYAAQGAAMAIEDAAALAAVVGRRPNDLAAALADYERLRRSRVKRVASRGNFNRFTWHAGGMAERARDLVLRLQPPRRLAASLDWLYGWDLDAELARLG